MGSHTLGDSRTRVNSGAWRKEPQSPELRAVPARMKLKPWEGSEDTGSGVGGGCLKENPIAVLGLRGPNSSGRLGKDLPQE